MLDALRALLYAALKGLAVSFEKLLSTTVHSDIPFLFGEQRHLLVPERDAQAIADRIQRYVDKPEALITDGARLRERICAFDIRECAARLSDLHNFRVRLTPWQLMV